MKKFLLSLATVALGFGFAQAAETTYAVDFSTNIPSDLSKWTIEAVSTTDATDKFDIEFTITDMVKNQGYIISKSNGSGTISFTLDKVCTSIKYISKSGASASQMVGLSVNDTQVVTPVKVPASTAGYLFEVPEANQAAGATYLLAAAGSKKTQLTKLEITLVDNATPPSVATPVISCADNMVTISAEEGADVYYTLDGTEPTTSSTKYEDAFPITETVTVKAIAVKGSDQSKVATYTAKYEGVFDGFAALVAGGDNTTGTVAGPLSVIYQSAPNLYMKDAKGGYMLVYDSKAPAGLVNGVKFASLEGTYVLYNNTTPEITNVTFGEQSTGDVVAPETPAIDAITADMRYAYVKLSGVSISALSGVNFTIGDGTNAVKGYNKFSKVVTVEEGEGFDIEGIVDLYRGDVQIIPISITGGGQVIEKVETPSILCSNNIVSITCATADAQVFYTTNGDEPDATAELYDGAFSITETVTVKAIALKEGYDTSDVAEKVCEYVGQGGDTPAIDSPAEFVFTPDSETVSSFASQTIASGNSQTDGESNDLTDVSITKQNVTLAFTANGTHPRWWTKGVRMYNGSTLTVSVPQGLQIDKITFTQASGDTKWGATVSTGTYDKTTKEWTPAAAEAAYADETPAAKPVASVTFTCGSTQTHFNTVKVDYSQDLTGVDSIVAGDDENAAVEYYNLQGVRVQNPANGLYIVKKGNKVSKQLIR